MSDTVIPFDAGRRRKGGPPVPASLPTEHQALHRRTKQARPKARELAAQQSAAEREKYAAAVGRQETERLLREGKPVPARITMALDMHGLVGPEVDEACGVEEPAVDMWEYGSLVPTPEQVVLLAKLTRSPVDWFYRPVPPGPLPGDGPMWVCSRSGPRGKRCQAVNPDVVDEHGVLHPGGVPRERPKMPAPKQGELF